MSPRLPKHILKAFVDLKRSANDLRQLPAESKNRVLNKLASDLVANSKTILAANKKDIQNAQKNKDVTAAFIDRLTLTSSRIEAMAESLSQVAKLPDPVNEIVDQQTLKNGLNIKRVRAPLGVLFMIFESRPNVITEVFSLAFKSGNAVALRGGSESSHTAKELYKLIRTALKFCNVDAKCFYGFEDYDRKVVATLLLRKDLIDVTIPRGGDKLIEFVTRTALMPIIKNDRGLCHAFVDENINSSLDFLKMAAKVVTNAKTSRPGVCNSLETVLIHKSIAEKFLPLLFDSCVKFNVVWKCDPKSFQILSKFKKASAAKILKAKTSDWGTEHLNQIINCKIVSGLDEALAHIEKYGSRHSEAILTEDTENASKFLNSVDAAAVYHNASTRFTDGFEFGLGGELGISTQKLHVRGPVGLKELTTPRWVIYGNGQIR
jgi:glutamate-5-semialdehyde dehydrogenase